MDLTGRLFGHYRVAEEISRGGMGVVYRATDTRLIRDVALKVLPDEFTSDAERRRRFIQEAQAASSLEHPHIAVIHDVGEIDGVAYIAMELIRGEKLSDILARERLPVARTLEIGSEVAAGLARAHEKQIVHRDLKPANVMITDEGHAKIIDFGIAKLIEPAVAVAQTQTSLHTGAGVVLGTMTYMSPEQARGDRVDHRSDVFSFGTVLHEMLAGQAPFQGKSGIETASAILTQTAPRLPALGAEVVPDASADIQRIVDKCLAKDPSDRYQGMKDVVVDLRAARRRLESTAQAVPVVPITSARPWPRRTWALGAAALVLAIVAGVLVSRRSGTPTAAGQRTASTDKPSVAVLYFDNTSGDKELDWLRTGITEMVVTDLSQSPALEVVGTDRLYDILAELKRADDRVISPDVIREVAERTGVDNVIVGSYARSGDAIRINLRLQEASTGRIVTSERVEGPNASSLFAMIDDLSRRVRSKFEGLRAEVGNATTLLTAPVKTPADTGLDRGLGDVTTSSIEAYRDYAEGINLHERFREAEAATLFEKAIAVDPSFAMAYVKLAVVHGNLGHLDLRDKYAALALKHADRLTPRERFYIEGYFYTLRPASLGRGIDAYKKCIEIDSGHQACRHNLALMLLILERTQEGIDHYEELVRRGSTNATAYGNLAGGYLALGDAEKALATTQVYSKRNPENATGHRAVAQALVGLGRYEEALQAVTRALLLDPTDQNILAVRVVAQTLREDWAASREAAATLYASPDATRKWSGALAHGRLAAFQGRSAEALSWAERAASAPRAPGPQSSGARQFGAGLLAARGQMSLALAQAQTALAEAKGLPPERAALSLGARLYAGSKQIKEADEAVAALAALADPLAPTRDARVLAVTRGQVALARGDFAAAIAELTKAQSALNPRTGNVIAPSQHVPVWFALGEAYMGAGQPAQAEAWFRRVAESGAEHAFQPIEFVRSFYYLGRIHEQAGDMTKARDAYRRFIGYWKDGDLDRERIAEAERKLRGQT